MATFQRKAAVIEAEQHTGDYHLVVMHNEWGQQHARKGDYLVGTDRGAVKVVPRAEFEAEWEPKVESIEDNGHKTSKKSVK